LEAVLAVERATGVAMVPHWINCSVGRCDR
jgi:hypothetical protein